MSRSPRGMNMQSTRPMIVMFIDDDPAFHTVVRRACKDLPSVGETMVASDGKEALRIIEDSARDGGVLPDAVFVDINMPILDGFGFLEGLQELIREYPRVADIKPIVMMTSSDQERDKMQAQHLGASDYMVKGVSLGEIRDSIRQVVS